MIFNLSPIKFNNLILLRMGEWGRKHQTWNKIREMGKWKKERGGGKWGKCLEKKVEGHSGCTIISTASVHY